MFGDPHMITLDHVPYTFNGHGEFTLIETLDDSFTLQGRMVPLRSTPQGTVFAAFAARVGSGGSRVMVSAESGAIEIFVDDRLVSRAKFQQREVLFNEFSLTLNGETLSIQFTNGINLECQANAQGFVARIVVGMPETFMNLTRGLLGVFNGIPGDDLTPAGANVNPVPTDADLRIIHERFGLTCERREGGSGGGGAGLGEGGTNFAYLFYDRVNRKFQQSLHLPSIYHIEHLHKPQLPASLQCAAWTECL